MKVCCYPNCICDRKLINPDDGIVICDWSLLASDIYGTDCIVKFYSSDLTL